MAPSLAELLHDWHDFYVLVGTASATLVGLMFVAVSIGTSIFNEDHRAAMTAFITPTVMHFAAVLFVCLLGTIPTHTWYTLGGLLGAGALAGSIYSGRLVVQMINPPPVQRRCERPVVLCVPAAGRICARADRGSAVAHTRRRKRRPDRRRGAHAASRRHSQRLGHDGLDRDQDACRRSASAVGWAKSREASVPLHQLRQATLPTLRRLIRPST